MKNPFKRFPDGTRAAYLGKVGTVISVKKAEERGAIARKNAATNRGILFDDGSVAIVHVNRLTEVAQQ